MSVSIFLRKLEQESVVVSIAQPGVDAQGFGREKPSQRLALKTDCASVRLT